MTRILVLFLAMSCFAPVVRAAGAGLDSLGITVIDGKTFIRHRIERGENLSLIARRYKVPMSDIITVNKLASADAIRADQVLLIPARGSAAASTSGASATSSGSGSSGTVHVVEKGETLFSIAKRYGISIEKLKTLNALSTDALNIGQKLRVAGESSAATSVVSKPEPPPVKPGDPPAEKTTTPKQMSADSKPVQGTGVTSDETRTGSLIDLIADMSPGERDSVMRENTFSELDVLTAPKSVILSPDAKVTEYKDPSSFKVLKQVEETGTAGFIDDYSTDQTKFYAFHKYLPPGSYIRVDYPAKKQSILVEVIQTLDKKDPHVVRLSAKCGHYLMLWKEGERVRLRYVVPSE